MYNIKNLHTTFKASCKRQRCGKLEQHYPPKNVIFVHNLSKPEKKIPATYEAKQYTITKTGAHTF